MATTQTEDKTMSFMRIAARDEVSTNDEDDRSLVTPQPVINSLPRYTIRNGAHTPADSFCGICYNKYNVGDRTISLPCHHNFHYYCIENWLKYVKAACPIDKRCVIRSQYWQDLANERRTQHSETHASNAATEVFLQISNNEDKDQQSSNSSDGGILDIITRNKIIRKKRDRKRIVTQKPKSEESSFDESEAQELELPQEMSTKFMPTLESQSDNKANISCHTHAEKPNTPDSNRNKKLKTPTDKIGLKVNENDSRIKFPDTQQLRDSVEAIRRSIEQNIPIRKKLENPTEYQDSLEEIATKLSESKIQSRRKSGNKNHSQKNKPPTKSGMKSTAIQKEIALNKKLFSFGDLLNLEKEEHSVKKRAILPKDVPAKYNRLMRKKS